MQQQSLDAASLYLRYGAPHGTVSLAAVHSLLEAVDLRGCLSVLDPFGKGRALASALSAAGTGIGVSIGERTSGGPLNALSTAFYDQVQRRGAIEAIVTGPWPGLLDFALPLAVAYTSRVVCCHVPLEYICHAHPPRRAWLAQLRDEQRLLFVHPRNPGARSDVVREVSTGVCVAGDPQDAS